MADDLPSQSEASAKGWPILNPIERRILGAMIEKAKTTPDAYPLSLNALVTACNQKSNRDPVLSLTDDEVEETLASLQQKGLVMKITGGRVVRWRHQLYEAWRLDKAELAAIGELLLRGAQTEGELRARASRMEPINDLDALRALLRPMSERGLVIYLTPPGRRGTVLTHGFHAPHEIAALKLSAGSQSEPDPAEERTEPSAAGRASVAAPGAASPEPRAEIRELRAMVEALQERVARLEQQVARSVGPTNEASGTPNASPASLSSAVTSR